MKSQIVKYFLVFAMAMICSPSASLAKSAVSYDPALHSAVLAQIRVLEKIYNKREKTQNKIIAADVAVSTALTRMHDVEDKILGYMENVQGAIQNLYEIKRAAKLVAIEIPNSMKEVRRAIGIGHFQGTFIATTASHELTEITEDMLSLYPFMAQLVTSGSYNVDVYEPGGIAPGKIVIDDKGVPSVVDGGTLPGKWTTEQKKVNLLNSAERYYVCTTVLSKLEDINTRLRLFAWQIMTMRWRDFFYELDPEGWCKLMGGYLSADYVVREWKYEMRYF